MITLAERIDWIAGMDRELDRVRAEERRLAARPDPSDVARLAELTSARLKLEAERAGWAVDLDDQLERRARIVAAVAELPKRPSCRRCGSDRGPVDLDRLDGMLDHVRGADEFAHARLVDVVRLFDVCGPCFDGQLERVLVALVPPAGRAASDAQLRAVETRGLRALRDLLAELEGDRQGDGGGAC